MRRLMWLSIGFAAACGLCAYLLAESWLLPLSAAAAIVCVVTAVIGRNHKLPRRIAWALAGCAIGFVWFLAFRHHYLLPAIAMDGKTGKTVILATDYSWNTDYGIAGDGTLELEGKTYQVRFYINEKKEIQPGDRIEGEFRFRITTPDGEKGATYHQGKGIFLLLYQSDVVEVSHTSENTIRIFASRLRKHIRDTLQSSFPEDAYPFAQALLLGDDTALDYTTDTAFKISGIRHIIAVSGLHVTILYALISTLTLKKRYLTALVGLPALLLFAALAGFTPSVTRACIMVALMIVATVFKREYDGPTELGFASLAMLMINPLAITSASLQLSAASVAGIFLFNERIGNWLKAHLGEGKGKSPKALLIRWFSSSVSVTLSAVSLTTPLCACYFGTVSLIGMLTNLLTLWAVSFIFYGIMAVCLMCLLSQSAAAVLAGVISWGIRYVLAVAKFCGSVPMAAVYTASGYIVFWLVFVYLLLVIFLITVKKKPMQLFCCAVLGLCVALLCSWMEPLGGECRVTVLDVGQGQCILLQAEGRTFLIDCGGDYEEDAADLAADTLLSQGISRLDGIILTHYDADHAGGVPYLLTRIEADCIYLPDTEDNGVGDTIASVSGGQIIRVWEDQYITFGNAEMTIFGPIYSGASNENSMCILFETENCAILVTGDRSAFGERMLLREHTLPQVDLLIAGHHGSKSSTSEELLTAVRPETVIISVGENSYGHPSGEVLERLEDYGCTVYRTDQQGTILFRR